MPELKPCPCGKGCKCEVVTDPGLRKYVLSACGWMGPMRRTAELAIAAWNARADAGMLDKALDAMEDAARITCGIIGAVGACRILQVALVDSGRYRWANEEHTAIERNK